MTERGSHARRCLMPGVEQILEEVLDLLLSVELLVLDLAAAPVVVVLLDAFALAIRSKLLAGESCAAAVAVIVVVLVAGNSPTIVARNGRSASLPFALLARLRWYHRGVRRWGVRSRWMRLMVIGPAVMKPPPESALLLLTILGTRVQCSTFLGSWMDVLTASDRLCGSFLGVYGIASLFDWTIMRSERRRDECNKREEDECWSHCWCRRERGRGGRVCMG